MSRRMTMAPPAGRFFGREREVEREVELPGPKMPDAEAACDDFAPEPACIIGNLALIKSYRSSLLLHEPCRLGNMADAEGVKFVTL
jgi:hypothetical protein